MVVGLVGNSVGVVGCGHELRHEGGVGIGLDPGAGSSVAVALSPGTAGLAGIVPIGQRRHRQVRRGHIGGQGGAGAGQLALGHRAVLGRLAHVPAVEHVAGLGRGRGAGHALNAQGHQVGVLGHIHRTARASRIGHAIGDVGIGLELRHESGIHVQAVLVDGQNLGQSRGIQLGRAAHRRVHRRAQGPFLAQKPAHEAVALIGHGLAADEAVGGGAQHLRRGQRLRRPLDNLDTAGRIVAGARRGAERAHLAVVGRRIGNAEGALALVLELRHKGGVRVQAVGILHHIGSSRLGRQHGVLVVHQGVHVLALIIHGAHVPPVEDEALVGQRLRAGDAGGAQHLDATVGLVGHLAVGLGLIGDAVYLSGARLELGHEGGVGVQGIRSSGVAAPVVGGHGVQIGHRGLVA